MLRLRVRKNMALALGHDVPKDAEKLYFKRLGWYLSNALAVFHHGIDASGVFDQIKSTESISFFDAALAKGRGAVLIGPHWCGHELIAAKFNRIYPMVFLVREAASAERMARKLKWYNALGAEILLRPSRASTIKDAVACLNILKRGKLLAITPDLLTDAPQGIATHLFGRQAKLHGGAFAIAIAAGVPMIRASLEWQSDSDLLVQLERAPNPPADCDRAAATAGALQSWCGWFERKLQIHPENWLFWLDKRWSRFLRTQPYG